MKTLAIVSSYAESCGNAAFTKILHDSIESYSNNQVQVDVVELNLSLLQSTHNKIRKTAELHVNDICEQLKKYDAVNIQFEAGLYGTIQKDIVSRVKRMISANPNTSVTLHSPRLSSKSYYKPTLLVTLGKILKGRLFTAIREHFTPGFDAHINTNHAVILYATKKQCELIVHTKRAKNQIKNFFGYEKTHVHPLVMVSDSFLHSSIKFDEIRASLGIKPDDVTIGMFGYISSYKGHTDAIGAMRYLPKEYKLMIFGRQHPQTLKDSSKDPYLTDLVKKIAQLRKYESRKLKKKWNSKDGVDVAENVIEKPEERVIFVGELPDDEFVQVASSVDVAWLPYYENGQDGSGIASICFDVCSRVVCSTSFAFDELFKLKKYNNFLRFDIGNKLELASKTKMIMSRPKPSPPYAINSTFDMKSQALVYINDLLS